MSASLADVRRKLEVIRDHGARSMIELFIRSDRRLSPQEIELMRAIVTNVAIESEKVGQWRAHNRVTAPPPAGENPWEGDTPTEPARKR